MKATLVLIGALFLLASCGSNSTSTSTSNDAAKASETPMPTPVIPKDGDYPAKGVVTKINPELGSIELNHEDIPGVMPPMVMEFFVTDKKMFNGLAVGDKVDFVLRYKHPTETIVEIKKEK